MQKLILSPETKNYADLCASYNAFAMPYFQRLYSWKLAQINDFFSAIIEHEGGYFVGSLVCVKESKTDSESPNLLLIDGQQRITTLNLLLIALRDALSKKRSPKAKHLIERINQHLTYYDYGADDELKVRLCPYKKILQDVYHDLFQGRLKPLKNYSKSQAAYLKSYEILTQLLKENCDGSIGGLEKIYAKIRNLTFIPIICESEAAIQELYSGLNSTGLGLSVFDLVKNEVLLGEKVKEGSVENMEETWSEIEDIISSVSPERLPKFVRHHWISINGYKTEQQIYPEIRDRIKKQDLDPKKYTEELKIAAEVYVELLGKKGTASIPPALSAIFKTETDLAMKFLSFSHLNNTQVLEVLLSLSLFYKANGTKHLKPRVLTQILDTLWTFCLRVQYLPLSPSKYERVFASIAQDLQERGQKEDIYSLFHPRKKALAKLIKSTDTTFVEFFSEGVNYNSNKNLIAHILENTYTTISGENLKFTDRTLEHILPQEPAEWGYKKKDIKPYVHSIGNITLLNQKENSLLKNKPFEEKVEKVFSKSVFVENQQIEENYSMFPTNPEEAIRLRSIDIAKSVAAKFKI